MTTAMGPSEAVHVKSSTMDARLIGAAGDKTKKASAQ